MTHLKFQKQSEDRITSALDLLRREGILPTAPSWLRLSNTLGQYQLQIGFRVPRPITLILKLLGLSPGELRLFQDAERGWMVEAIEQPGAQPVFKYVTDEVAATLIRGELTHELEAELMTPEPDYIA